MWVYGGKGGQGYNEIVAQGEVVHQYLSAWPYEDRARTFSFSPLSP
jgi:hypothetical protein